MGPLDAFLEPHDVHFDPYVGNSSCDFPEIQVIEEGGYSGRDVMFCIL